jgi:hypothetical protein
LAESGEALFHQGAANKIRGVPGAGQQFDARPIMRDGGGLVSCRET